MECSSHKRILRKNEVSKLSVQIAFVLLLKSYVSLSNRIDRKIGYLLKYNLFTLKLYGIIRSHLIVCYVRCKNTQWVKCCLYRCS